MLALSFVALLPLAPAVARPTGVDEGRAGIEVIVRAADAEAARAAVEAVGGDVLAMLPIVDGVSATVAPRSVARLTAAGVDVTVNAPVTVQAAPTPVRAATSVYPRAINAHQLWKAGYKGGGVTVAVIDTGIAPVRDLAGRVVGGIDLTPEQDPRRDSFGHGTFVAGLIAGNGSRKGTAPAANLVSVKIAGRDGASDVAHVLAALQWVVSFKDTYQIRVVNLSLGTDSTQPYQLSPINHAVERAWDAGIVVVVSASNRGLDGPRTVTKPADDPLVITVGATDDRGTITPRDDIMAGFSGIGPTAADGLTKPDVVAPGRSVVSLRAPGSTIDRAYPSARVGTTYFKGSGTSFSSAVTAGAAALLLDHRPGLSPDQVKALLMDNALAGPSADPNVSGAGRLDAGKAFADTTPGEANQGVPRSLGLGSLDADRGSLQTAWINDLGVGTLLTGLLTPQGKLFDPVEFLDPTTWTSTKWYESQWASTKWYSTKWYGTRWYSTKWYSTKWYGATWYGIAWE